MCYITGQTEQGNCLPAELRDGVFICRPDVPERVLRLGKTNTWHMWCAKACGKKGEHIKVRLEWPLYDPDLVSDEIKNMPNYEAEWESFVRPAQDVIFKSTDRIHWERVCDVKLEGNSLYFETDLASEETFFTVTLYYTMENYKNLVDTVRGNEYIKTEIIGTDDGGDDIYAFTASDFSVPESEKICVYLQGAQHCSEFNGAHICDFMLRFFADGNAEAKALLKKYVFQFVPVVSVTSWRLGLDVHSSGINPNRDWIEKKLPSTKAVHRYLDSLENKPLLLIDIHSGLANYGCWETCQALSINDDLSEEEKSEMRRFIDIVYENCDFLPTRRYWSGLVDDNMFDGYGLAFGQTHTMEVSHYAIYDREEKRHFPISQTRLEKYAKQLAFAIYMFFEGKTK